MVKLEHVSKRIKDRMVLSDVDFTFQDGKVYGLKGINGAGKTMLMRVISGLIYPTEGRVLINGKELGKDISFPKKTGMLLENPVFLDSYTGFDNLKLLASLQGESNEHEIEDAMIKVGLEPADKRKYKKYSLGMKQRLGIASAIMENPNILILDEPTNALDASGIDLFREIIADEKARGVLVIMSCHDETMLRTYADVVLSIEDGKLVGVEELVQI